MYGKENILILPELREGFIGEMLKQDAESVKKIYLLQSTLNSYKSKLVLEKDEDSKKELQGLILQISTDIRIAIDGLRVKGIININFRENPLTNVYQPLLYKPTCLDMSSKELVLKDIDIFGPTQVNSVPELFCHLLNNGKKYIVKFLFLIEVYNKFQY
jgi:hypothetical protein